MLNLKSKTAAILSAVLLGGFLTLNAIAAESSGFNSDTNIGVLLDNPEAKAIVYKNIPIFLTRTALELAIARGLTLNELAPLSDGRVTEAMVKATEEELRKLK